MFQGSAPPKGYSVPRYEGRKTERKCQHCASKEHWSYECPKRSDKKVKTGKLSQSQMLKYGIKRRRTEFEPESTKAEKLKKELDALNDTAPTAEKETIKEDERKSEEGDVTNVSQENSVKKVKKEEDEE